MHNFKQIKCIQAFRNHCSNQPILNTKPTKFSQQKIDYSQNISITHTHSDPKPRPKVKIGIESGQPGLYRFDPNPEGGRPDICATNSKAKVDRLWERTRPPMWQIQFQNRLLIARQARLILQYMLGRVCAAFSVSKVRGRVVRCLSFVLRLLCLWPVTWPRFVCVAGFFVLEMSFERFVWRMGWGVLWDFHGHRCV